MWGLTWNSRIVEQSLRQAALWDEVKNRLKNSGLSLSGGQAQLPQRLSRGGRGRTPGRRFSSLGV